MTLAAAVPLALSSAGLFAVGTAVQQQAAAAHPRTDQGPVRLILALARRPAWLLSNLALIAGVVLHGVALSKGSLVVVQPLLVTGLLFAIPLSARLHRRRVTPAQWLWATVTVVGLALFLLLSGGGSGHSRPDLNASRSGIVIAAATLAVMSGTGIAAASWRGPRAKAALYGVASGTAAGLAAAALKASTGLLGDPHFGVVRSPYPYLALALATVAFVLSQAAYRSGPLPASVPALTLADPVASIAVGIGLFAERLRGGPVTTLLEGLVLVATFTAVVALARAEQAPPDHPGAGDAPGGRDVSPASGPAAHRPADAASYRP